LLTFCEREPGATSSRPDFYNGKDKEAKYTSTRKRTKRWPQLTT
jgi:hypothetical protein